MHLFYETHLFLLAKGVLFFGVIFRLYTEYLKNCSSGYKQIHFLEEMVKLQFVEINVPEILQIPLMVMSMLKFLQSMYNAKVKKADDLYYIREVLP
jgi:hypothetical protein